MVLTVYRQPILARSETDTVRTTRPLQVFDLEGELRPRKRVAVRFPMGDWIEFRDSGEPCLEAMRDYVLALESVALVRVARLKEEAARKKARKAGFA